MKNPLIQRLSNAAGQADLAHEPHLADLLRLAGGELAEHEHLTAMTAEQWRERLGEPRPRTLPEMILYLIDAVQDHSVPELSEAVGYDFPEQLRSIVVALFPPPGPDKL